MEHWRREALGKALVSLLPRAASPDLQARLIKASTRDEIITLIATGALPADGLPIVTAVHGVWPELIATLAGQSGQLANAVRLLASLDFARLGEVLTWWHLTGSEVPHPLAEAVCRRLLEPLTDEYPPPQTHLDWVQRLVYGHGDWLGTYDDTPWRILEAHPELWARLAVHSRFGRWVQHLLLERADTDLLDGALLSTCLPVAVCPELTGLPRPGLTARERLRRLAHRVRRHPRLLALVPHDIHAAAADCVTRGRLLRLPRKRAQDIVAIAEDLAVVGAEPRHLTRAVALLAGLPRPVVVADLPSLRGTAWYTSAEEESHRLLEHRDQHLRARALAHVAANPAVPSTVMTDALTSLHPAELTWIRRFPGTPVWYAQVAAAMPVPEDQGVLRIVPDQELDAHPAPAVVLQSWLDTARSTNFWVRERLYSAVLRSRHRTESLLRQLPARHILTMGPPEVTAGLVLAFCGSDPVRWAALAEALNSPMGEARSFGEFLDRIALAAARQGRGASPAGGQPPAISSGASAQCAYRGGDSGSVIPQPTSRT
ncbi:hypothetical protein ACIHFE_27220 [Streptomyces sp. NPDC052396]|uniref:hypothetical protein n=1 Tax=Streptomyces sp. NPDC052396 TaxID=3365689 RepID=UPI0037D4C1F5